jgi:hypothetical protein
MVVQELVQFSLLNFAPKFVVQSYSVPSPMSIFVKPLSFRFPLRFLSHSSHKQGDRIGS